MSITDLNEGFTLIQSLSYLSLLKRFVSALELVKAAASGDHEKCNRILSVSGSNVTMKLLKALDSKIELIEN